MSRLVSLLAVLLVATGLSVVAATPAHADTRHCRGTIGPRAVEKDINVPRGATCWLRSTRVDGNVTVRRGARLFTRGARIEGNIQGWKAKRVGVRPNQAGRRTFVDGNIQLNRGWRKGGLIARARVEGDIQLFGNNGRFRVRGNIVDGNLQCKSNRPKPVGGHNRVHGNKEGQCRGL